MIKADMFLVASGVVRDVETSNVSVFNILDTITAGGFPVIIQKMYLYVKTSRAVDDPDIAECRLQVLINDKELVSTPMSLNFEDKTKNNAVMELNGLMIPRPGELRFVLCLNNKDELGEYVIEIKEPKTEKE